MMYKTLLNRYKWHLAVSLPVSFLLGVVRMVLLASFSHALSGAGRDSIDFLDFLLAIVALLVISVLHGCFEVSISCKANRDIQVEMINRVTSTTYSTLENIGLPRIIATLTEDVRSAAKLFDNLPKLLVNLSTIVCGFAYMGYLSLSILAATVATLAFGVFTVLLMGWASQKQRMSLRNVIDEINFSYQDITLGAKEINLNSKRKRFLLRTVHETTERIRKLSKFVNDVRIVTEQWIQFVIYFIIGGLIYYVGSAFGVEHEVIVGFVMALLFLIPAIFSATDSITNLLEAQVAFAKIDQLGLTASSVGTVPAEREIESERRVHTCSARADSLVLKDIQYSYQGDKDTIPFTLGPISAQFKAGEAVLIIGGNGSGKSTLMKVMSGLYSSDKGDIYLSDDEGNRSIVDSFSYISPSFWLFEDLINTNGERCDDIIIKRYLSDLHLDGVVSSSNGRLSTLDLSHGQRKRLALIQMFLEDRDVVLMDEWAADQDPMYKQIYYGEIIPLLKKQGKIVIFVSHDDHYYMQPADRVFKLDEGKLMEIPLKG